MIWHPLILMVFLLDLAGILFLAVSGKTAMNILARWSPGSPGREQIRLEVESEAAGIYARAGSVLVFISTLVWVFAVTNVFNELVPGAMCGTGVMEATGGLGNRALFFRLLGLLVLFYHGALAGLDRQRPYRPLILTCSRVLLAAFPIVALGVLDTARATLGLSGNRAVNCCAVVYDDFSSKTQALSTAGVPDIVWVGAFVFGAVLMAAAGFWLWRALARVESGKGEGGDGSGKWTNTAGHGRAWSVMSKLAGLVALLSILWTPVAVVVLTNVLAAYHYGVPHHQCPWCLFSWEYHGVGFVLFGALAVVLAEGTLCRFAIGTAMRQPELFNIARNRTKLALIRLLAAQLVFLCLSGLPAIAWRLRFGVWID